MNKTLRFYLAIIFVFMAFSTPQPVYAAGIIVNTNADNLTDDGLCTLREAITTANSDSDINTGDCSTGSGSDIITFAGNYTITLSGSQLPAITTNITIQGTGATNTIIQANATPNTATYRIFEVSTTGDLTLNHSTVQHGNCNGSCATYTTSGGGILNQGQVNISNSTIANNSASFGGGGMYNDTSSNTSLTNVIFSANSVTSFGGGMYNNSSVTLTNVTFSGNSSANNGGGMYNNDNSSLTLTNVTLNNNSSTNNGGGMYNDTSSPTISNVTFSNNSANRGGGIYNDSFSTLTLKNVTFSDNFASSEGGGMYNNNSTPTLRNVIIANSTSGGDCVNNSSTLNASSSNNLIEDTTNACGLTNGLNGNIIGSDPILGSLANNGGLTLTHALLTGSPAINTGDNTICAAAPVNNTSQNGVARPNGTNCDIGSFEKIVAATFADVPTNGFAWAHIESIYTAGITGGCSTSPLNYCPNGTVTRAQMAVFLMKGIHGSAYSPPPATGTVFNDVPIGSFAAAFIEAFATEGITGGCGNGNFCPSGLVTRAQMAVFLLKAKHGSAYTPPAATGTMFNDVPSNAFAAAWIEQLATEGITGGCGNGNYCPNASVTRAQMAVFLQKTFDLPLP